jgi:Tfp pilus assembly protein PilP
MSTVWSAQKLGCVTLGFMFVAAGSAFAGTQDAGNRRDPFESLLRERASRAIVDRPAGTFGLVIDTLRVNGIVKSPKGLIAVVTNSTGRTYFLQEGTRLYDGSVEKISMDGVSFHEEGKDAFGKPVEHQVNKRIYSSPGEQQ